MGAITSLNLTPNDGRPMKQLSKVAVNHLPEVGTMYHFAKILGVTKGTVGFWIHRYGLPAFKQEDGTFTIDRELFIQWAIKTGRYKA